MYLRQGDIIDIVAPGSAASTQELSLGAECLKSWGLVPRFPHDIFKSRNHYLAQSDEKRFSFLRKALSNSSSRAVWCVRGGYGSIRLLPYLQKMSLPKKQKLFIGSSDVTSLHLFLQQQWGWKTIHGPLLERVGRRDYGVQAERDIKKFFVTGGVTNGDTGGVTGREVENQKTTHNNTLTYKGLRPMNEEARKDKILRAPVTGGNLTVASSTLGTPWQMQTEGKILFFEEVGERGYRIDRFFQQWLQTGQLQKCRAIILGEFKDCQESNGRKLWQRAIRDLAENLKKPVLTGFPCGHGKIQKPILFGGESHLHLGTLPFMETFLDSKKNGLL